jgi:hypothetical protein
VKGRAPSTKPVHRTTRKRRRARAGVADPITHRQIMQARRQAQEATLRRYQLLGRAPVASADPDLVDAHTIRTRLVRKAAKIVDADPTLVAWVTDLIEAGYKRPGRPRELTVRTALICFVLQAIVHKNFLLFHLPRTLAAMTWRVKRELGISYLKKDGRPSQVSYTQILGIFHTLADTFDAWDDDLGALDENALVRAEQAANLQEFIDRLIRASNHAAPMWSGNGALGTPAWCSVELEDRPERQRRRGRPTRPVERHRCGR